jgi:arylsulfatase A-like enzyme
VRRPAFIALRLAFFGACYLASIDCLLTFTPFTFTHVIQAGILPWLGSFVRLSPWIFVAATACALATLAPDLRGGRDRHVARGYAALMIAAAAALARWPVLRSLGNEPRAFVWCEIALAPILGLALVDHLAVRGKIRWAAGAPREDRAVFQASVATLALGYLTYAATFHVRASTSLGLGARDEAVALAWSFLLHACFVGAAYAVFSLTRALAAYAGPRAALAEYVGVLVIMGALFALLARNVVFTAISLAGARALVAAVSWGVAVVLTVSGMALRGAAESGAPVESGLRLFLQPLAPAGASARSVSSLTTPPWTERARLAVRIGWLVALVVVAVRLEIVAARMDVNGLMQKLCACLVWILIFAAALPALERPIVRRLSAVALVACACSAALVYRGWRSFGRPADSVPVLEKLAAADPSFGLLHDLAGSEGRRESMGDLFDFMQRNTSFPKERRIDPLDVTFSNAIGSAPGPRPHIFVIVIDSLRRDYLSPYNPAVTFTPSIDAFARSSDVFVNAFTHYGATGLSEPSIWVGGMMPHKQYITPFSPMNSLEKLLVGEGYQRMVSVDSILAQILDRSGTFSHLDERAATGDYDLCDTLEELRGEIDARKDRGDRLFAYTQPQNVHVSRIAREGESVPGGAHFPGFYDPYAARLQRIDACFGKFVDHLKAQGLYDESVVVLTADHGDLLGEEGRWGHAYNLNPEVVRIPLILHRPRRLEHLAVDTSAIAFSTDITPSLYRLLGYAPADLGAWFGRSLYGHRAEGREWHLMVSSYGPVYGILEDAGRHLYVADAIGYTDTYYDVAAGSNAPRDPVAEDVRRRNVQRIMAGVKELHDAFHVEAASGAPPP